MAAREMRRVAVYGSRLLRVQPPLTGDAAVDRLSNLLRRDGVTIHWNKKDDKLRRVAPGTAARMTEVRRGCEGRGAVGEEDGAKEYMPFWAQMCLSLNEPSLTFEPPRPEDVQYSYG